MKNLINNSCIANSNHLTQTQIPQRAGYIPSAKSLDFAADQQCGPAAAAAAQLCEAKLRALLLPAKGAPCCHDPNVQLCGAPRPTMYTGGAARARACVSYEARVCRF